MVVRLYGHAYQLERKLHGGRGDRNGEEQEGERQQIKFNNRKILQPFVSFSFKKKKNFLNVFMIMLCQTSPFKEKSVYPLMHEGFKV